MTGVPFKRSEVEIRDWCVGYLATLLDIAATTIDPNAKFARLGMDSALTVSFILALEEWVKMEFDAEVTFDHPTISELAKYVSARSSGQMPQ
jgi:acyl carrier protein